MNTRLRNFGGCFAVIFLLVVCAANFVSCVEFEDNDAAAVSDSGYAGDYFDDVPEAYVLTRSTKPSSLLPGKGDAEYPYRIRNASDFLCFINMVNGDDFYSGQNLTSVHVQLEHDIEVDETYPWVPIFDSYAKGSKVYGEFNGMGHKITGTLDCEPIIDDRFANVYAGFFGVISISVKDLTMDADINVSYSIGGGKQNGTLCFSAGGLAAWALDVLSVQNCNFTGNISVCHLIEANTFAVGGLIGMGGATVGNGVSGCTSSGTFELKELFAEDVMIGGICGWSRGESSSSSGCFIECVNKTNIMLSGYSCDKLYVGGIYGAAFDDINNAARHDRIVRCENYGVISLTNGSLCYLTDRTFESDAYTYVGGIVGLAVKPDEFADNTNYADITVKDVENNTYVGGLGGKIGNVCSFCENNGSVTNSCNYGRATGGCLGVSSFDVYMFINRGSVYGVGRTGGVVGLADDGSIHLCTNEGDVDGHGSGDGLHAVGGIVGCSIGNSMVYSCCINEGKIYGMQPSLDTSDVYFVGDGHPVDMCSGDHSQWE